MKKPSMSKQSIGNFFLHHTEKLILALCLALFGLFFWMGLKTKPFDSKSPTDLVRMSERADKHVKNPAVWDAIKPYQRLRADSYKVDTLTGIPAKTLDARKDPVLERPEHPYARHFRAPLLIAMSGPFRNVYDEMTPVSAPEIGSGTRAGGAQYEEEYEIDEEEQYEEDFGAQGYGARGSSTKNDDREKEEAPPEVDAGAQFQTVTSHTWPGIIPSAHGIGPERNKSVIMDVATFPIAINQPISMLKCSGVSRAASGLIVLSGFSSSYPRSILRCITCQGRFIRLLQKPWRLCTTTRCLLGQTRPSRCMTIRRLTVTQNLSI